MHVLYVYNFPSFHTLGSTLKNKYNHVKSSGYGQQSPGRTPSKERPSSAKERGTLRAEEHRGAQHGGKDMGQERAKKERSKERVGKDRGQERAGKKEKRLREVGQTSQPWSPADISRQKIIGN
jgi:hypothetical protein